MGFQELLGSDNVYAICTVLSLISVGLFVAVRWFLTPDSPGYTIYTALGMAVLALVIAFLVGHFLVKNDMGTEPVICPVCSMEVETPFCGHCGASVNLEG